MNLRSIILVENVPPWEYNKKVMFILKWRHFMEFLSTSEIAKIWNISRRRVTTLCIQGRIEGAVHKGNMWLIPEDAKKPDDPRRVLKKGQQE